MRSPRDLRCTDQIRAECGRRLLWAGFPTNSEIERSARWIRGRLWGQRTDVASHTYLATIRGWPVMPPNRPRRALESVGPRRGSREKRLHSPTTKKRQMPSHLDFIDQWGSSWFATRRNSCTAVESSRASDQSSERVGHPRTIVDVWVPRIATEPNGTAAR